MNTPNEEDANMTNSSNYTRRIYDEDEESRGGEDMKTIAENHELGRVRLTPNQEKPASLD